MSKIHFCALDELLIELQTFQDEKHVCSETAYTVCMHLWILLHFPEHESWRTDLAGWETISSKQVPC